MSEMEMREVFGRMLVDMARENPNIFVLDGDLNTSTRTDLFLAEFRPNDYTGAFARIARERPHALITSINAHHYTYRGLIAEFAARYRLPSMSTFREFAEAGGLMSYGVDLRDIQRRAATYVDKILKGAKPADLPIEQPTKFELVINLKTAKALGLTIPPSLLQRADQVIE